MLINIDQLREYDFQLSNVRIIHQEPTYRLLNNKGRRVNGFLYILHGTCTYSFDKGSFTLVPGSVAYLPVGSVHTLEILSDDIEFYRIDFTLTINGNVAYFSNMPLKMCHVATKECAQAIQELADGYQFIHDSIRKTQLMCTVFHSLASAFMDPRRERLAPAVQHILEHLTDKFDCKDLARACNLSTAQLYNLFYAQYQLTPLAYRDSIIMDRAVLLLQDGIISVTQIAEMLGFESVAYFSRFFKKHKGVSPSKFLDSAK